MPCQVRPTIKWLKEKYKQDVFFLTHWFGNGVVVTMHDSPKARKLVERMRRDGLLCIPEYDYWYITYKDKE